jgi:hypothetical protein
MEATGKTVQARARGGDGLAQLKWRFDQWRAGRKLGTRIPVELWAEAVEMVAMHGACRVAGDLHLDYDMLKQRVALAGSKAPTTQLAPRFVELFAPAGPMPAVDASHPECVLEMANARGAKMRVELNGNGLGGLSALCSAFWAA